MDIDRKFIIQILIIITLSLICLQIIDNFYGRPIWQFTRLFNMSLESNFPTWISSMILLMAAYSANRCALCVRGNPSEKRLWIITAAGLLFMSFDEVAMVHEYLGGGITKYLMATKIFSTSWVVILGPIVLIVFLIYFPFLMKCLKDSGKAFKWISIGFFVYLTGAVLLESLINYIAPAKIIWLSRTEAILEEAFEMLGMIILIQGLLCHEEFLKQIDVNMKVKAV